MWKEIKVIFTLEWRNEIRNYNSIASVLLFVLCSILLVYLTFKRVDNFIWVSLFWFIQLFAAIQYSIGSSIFSKRSLHPYYYQICSPNAFYLTYSAICFAYLEIISLISFAGFSLLMSSPITNIALFLLVLTLGNLTLAFSLMLISQIAFRSGKGMSLLPILGIPVLLPIMILCVKSSIFSMDNFTIFEMKTQLIQIFGLFSIVCSSGLILFQYIWRD